MDLSAHFINSILENEKLNTFLQSEILEHMDNGSLEGRLSELVKWITTAPPDTTLRINTLHTDASSILTQIQQLLEEEYRQRGLDLKPQVVLHSQLPDLAMVSVPPTAQPDPLPSQVVVDGPCGEAVLRGAHVFAPAVLACPFYLQQGAQVSVYADIAGLCRRGLTKTFDGPKLFVGNGKMVLSRAELFASNRPPSGLAVRMEATPLNCPPLHGLLPGMVFPQNLPSVVCGHVLGAQPGELVLDLCAAPGGKTNHIATLMEDKGVVVALDKSSSKVARLKNNVQSWGLMSVQAFKSDSCRAANDSLTTPDTAEGRHKLLQEQRGPPYPPELFDRVLLDAPCSGLGQRPRLSLSHYDVTQISSFPPLQKTLFSAAVKLVRKGGTLVYSTCSLARGENEGLVEWALDNFPCLQLVPQEPHLGGRGWGGDSRLPLLQRFPPTFSPQTSIGFFIAKFIKT